MSDALADPGTLGDLDEAGLAEALRPLWEDAGPLVARLKGRSWDSWDQVIDRAGEEIAAMSELERVDLLRAHPRLGESPEALRVRSEVSWREQGGRRPLDDAAALRLHRLNQAYEERFGFPFVEWVRGRPLAAMIDVVDFRLGRDRGTELSAGCEAMIAIARDRLAKLRTG